MLEKRVIVWQQMLLLKLCVLFSWCYFMVLSMVIWSFFLSLPIQQCDHRTIFSDQCFHAQLLVAAGFPWCLRSLFDSARTENTNLKNTCSVWDSASNFSICSFFFFSQFSHCVLTTSMQAWRLNTNQKAKVGWLRLKALVGNSSSCQGMCWTHDSCWQWLMLYTSWLPATWKLGYFPF